MEDSNNLIFNNNNIVKNEKPQMSFSEYFYNGIDIMPVLNESLEKMRKFIIFIIEQLKKVSEKKEGKQAMFMSEKIFNLLLTNFEKFGLPFFYELLNKEEFKNILINLFLDNLYVEKIRQFMLKIIYLFNFDFDQKEMDHPFESLYNDCISFGIVTKEDLEEEEKRDSFSDEEIIFLETESLKNIWKNFRHNDEENNAKEFLESLLTSCEDQLGKLIGGEEIPKSSIEYYKEKINDIIHYKNKMNLKNENKKNEKEIKDINIKFYSSDEEEYDDNIVEDDEIKTPEQIKQDILEQRKKPLKDRTYFYKDEYIIFDENEYIEYKNYYFPLSIFQEKELQRQFCAFLNTNGGRLYIGINDKEKMIKGVLIRHPIKYYEEKILRLVSKFRPSFDPKKYFKFYAIPIKDNKNGKIKNNLFIFKILIKKGDPTKLYYIFSQGLNISTRQAGQCPNLKASEIYEAIIAKKNMKKLEQNENQINKIEQIEFDDPEPLYNQRIKNNELYKLNKKQKKNKKPINNKININNYNYNINQNYNINNEINFNNNNNNKIYNNEINLNNNNEIYNNKEENLNNKDQMNIENNDKHYNNNMNENENNNYNNYIPKKKKHNKKKKKKKGYGQRIVEVSNIDNKVDDKNMLVFFQQFNYKDIKFFTTQNGEKKCSLVFNGDEDADNFISCCNGMAFGDKYIKAKKLTS